MVASGSNREKAACLVDSAKPCIPTSETTEHLTLCLFIAANGTHLRPTVIFPLKNAPALVNEITQYYNIAGQDNGWINGAIFTQLIMDQFVSEINDYRTKNNCQNQYCMLLLDNHSSRNNLNTELLLNQHKIVIWFLPPHSSHITQPLDLSCNGVLKQQLAKLYKHDPNDDASLRRNKILLACKRALSSALCENTILTGFERTGLWPFNKKVGMKEEMFHPLLDERPLKKPKSIDNKAVIIKDKVVKLK